MVMNSTVDPNRAIAKQSQSTLNVDSKPIFDGFGYFEGYNINENNYIKLRALAVILDGTAKEFKVTLDEANKAINLTSYKSH